MVLPLSNPVLTPTLSRKGLEVALGDSEVQVVGVGSEQGLVDSRISARFLVAVGREDLQEIFLSSCLVRMREEGGVPGQTSTYEGPTLRPRLTSVSWKPRRERPRRSLSSRSPTVVPALGRG
jgi:hypothetical protein